MTDDGNRIYIAIDLKSFYASVECVALGRDPLTTNLVVADESRTEKTICLAVSPSLKSYGISGRARLFEAVQRIKEVNAGRKYALRGRPFSGKSDDYTALSSDPSLEVDFIRAVPRMREYMRVSGQVYSVYLRDVSP
ncbi:MAG: DNA methylase, partial [Clostridia bacterium]|nr:DNA methylase [Clostridia bacterium]